MVNCVDSLRVMSEVPQEVTKKAKILQVFRRLILSTPSVICRMLKWQASRAWIYPDLLIFSAMVKVC